MATHEFRPEKLVGDYTAIVWPCIGNGTFGRVYKANHNKTHEKWL